MCIHTNTHMHVHTLTHTHTHTLSVSLKWCTYGCHVETFSLTKEPDEIVYMHFSSKRHTDIPCRNPVSIAVHAGIRRKHLFVSVPLLQSKTLRFSQCWVRRLGVQPFPHNRMYFRPGKITSAYMLPNTSASALLTLGTSVTEFALSWKLLCWK